MKKTSLIFALIAIFAVSGFAASIHTEAADTSPAIRIYNGYTGTVSIVIYGAGAAATNSVTVDGLANTVDGSGTIDTVTELSAAITACTNAAGQAKLAADTRCSLGADSTDGELLTGTYTATAGNWLEIPWDTSAAKFYSVYIPSQKYDPNRVQNTIKTVYGTVTGTGDANVSIYLNGTLAWEKAVAEPTALGGESNDTVTVISNVIDLPVDADIPFSPSQSAMIRVTRASTATTGTIGVTVE